MVPKTEHANGAGGSYELRESSSPYTSVLGHENDGLRLQNDYFWDDSDGKSEG
jgi:hypothetical protein